MTALLPAAANPPRADPPDRAHRAHRGRPARHRRHAPGGHHRSVSVTRESSPYWLRAVMSPRMTWPVAIRPRWSGRTPPGGTGNSATSMPTDNEAARYAVHLMRFRSQQPRLAISWVRPPGPYLARSPRRDPPQVHHRSSSRRPRVGSSLASASRYISRTTSRDHESCPASWLTPGANAAHFRLNGLDLCGLVLAPCLLGCVGTGW